MVKARDNVRDLRVEVRKASASKPEVTHKYSVTDAASVFRLKTEDGRLTFAGAYFMLMEDVFNERKLSQKTAGAYNRTVCKYVLGGFNGPAFEDMMEMDFTAPWNRIVDSDISYSSLRNASVVIRTMMKLAYQRGLTHTILWGLPERHAKRDNQYRTLPEEEGMRLARLILNNSRTFSLTAELRFVRVNLMHVDTNGEAVGALIMLECGTRTSETTAFSYKHLTKVSDGYYALVRYDVSDKDSTHTSAGGKTMNAFRLIPLPAFLAEILLQRRAKLEEIYSKEEVDALPICCKGTDDTCRCKQAELNEFIKNMYKLAGVSEDILIDTYYNMHEDPEGAEDSEGYATAYLCWHQFATAMSYCGLTQGEIYIVMGHKIEVESVVKSDYSTPSKFRELSDKMDRRPNVYIFNREFGASRGRSADVVPNKGAEMEIHSDGDVVVKMPEDVNFSMEMLSRKRGVPLDVETTGDCKLRMQHFVIPDVGGTEDISCYSELIQCAEKAWAQIQDEAYERMPARALVDVDEVVRMIEEKVKAGKLEMDVSKAEETENEEKAAVAGMEELIDMDPEADDPEPGCEEPDFVEGDESKGDADKAPAAEELLPAGGEPAEVAEPCEELSESDELSTLRNNAEDVAQAAQKKARRRSRYGPVLWVADSAGRISRVDYPTQKQRRGLVGKKLPACTGEIVPTRVFLHDTAHMALLLSSEGVLYKIPKRTQLDSAEFVDKSNPVYCALKGGAIMLQRPEVMEGNGVIVCVANTGRMRKVSLDAYKRISANGRQMVTLREGEHIVAACLCAKDEDVLIMSAQGMMLRISAGDLRAVSSTAALVAGMRIRERDQPTACIAYHENVEYLAVTKLGMAARYDRTVEHMAHGTNTAGRAYMKVNEADQTLALLRPKDALYLVNNEGFRVCCDMDEIRPIKGCVQGVITQALKEQANQRIIAALALEVPLPEERAG